jgi:hypothetical protein
MLSSVYMLSDTMKGVSPMATKENDASHGELLVTTKISVCSKTLMIDPILITILSLLTWNERRHQCAMACHRFHRLARHPLANIYLTINITNLNPPCLDRCDLPWTKIQTIHLIDDFKQYLHYCVWFFVNRSPHIDSCNSSSCDCAIATSAKIELGRVMIMSDNGNVKAGNTPIKLQQFPSVFLSSLHLMILSPIYLTSLVYHGYDCHTVLVQLVGGE